MSRAIMLRQRVTLAGVRAARYRVVVKGELGPGYAPAFEGMELRSDRGDTVISGPIADQSELRGLLERLDSLGLELVSVQPVASSDE